MKLFFIKTALLLSQQSKCVSYKVGCLIVKDNRIISLGYNGSPPKFTNCNSIFNKDSFDREKHHAWSNIYESHAELASILYAAKKGINISDSEMYCTLFPCDQCLKNLVQSGVKKIYYVFNYDKVTQENKLLDLIEIEQVYNDEIKDFIEKNNLKFNEL
jgi:dCMP deaminase